MLGRRGCEEWRQLRAETEGASGLSLPQALARHGLRGVDLLRLGSEGDCFPLPE